MEKFEIKFDHEKIKLEELRGINDSILKLFEEDGRQGEIRVSVDEEVRKVIQEACFEIKEILRRMFEENSIEKGLDSIKDELDKIMEMIQNGKINTRSAVADRHLKMEAIVRELKK